MTSASLAEIAVITSFYEAFNAAEIDSAVEFLSESFDWRPAFGRGLMGGNSYVGHEGFRRYFEDLRDAFATYTVELQGIERIKEGVWVATVRSIAHGYASGIDIDRGFAIVYEVRDGELVRGETFADPAGARRAAAGSGGRA
jgi:ketosteroid isomerase-like protein